MIVHIVPGFLGGGAVAMRAAREVAAHRERGVDARIVTNVLPAGVRVPADWRDHPGLSIIAVRCVCIPGPLFMVSLEMSFNRRLARLLPELHRKEGIDLAVMHNSASSFPVARFHRRTGCPSAFVVHALIWNRLEGGASPYNPPLTTWYRLANRHALRHSSRVVALTPALERSCWDHGAPRDRTVVLPNGVNPRVFHPAPADKDIDVLYVGRFSVEKGIHTLIDALRRCSPPLRVHTAGDGPLLEFFRGETMNLPLEITIHGFLTNTEIPSLMRRSRVQVVPSNSEAQPFVVAEAMACGTPVLATGVHGIVDMIEDGRTGWLVPRGDGAALHKSLERILAEEPERVRVAKAALAASRPFQEPVTIDNALRFYDELRRSAERAPQARTSTGLARADDGPCQE